MAAWINEGKYPHRPVQICHFQLPAASHAATSGGRTNAASHAFHPCHFPKARLWVLDRPHASIKGRSQEVQELVHTYVPQQSLAV